MDTFAPRMRELGYVEGKNLIIDWRFAEGKLERLPELAAELLRLKVDVIVVEANVGLPRRRKQAPPFRS